MSEQRIAGPEKPMKSVVITGASTGIGWAAAKLLLERGFRVFGSVRKQADADRLKSEFGADFNPLILDVTDEAAVLAAAREVRGRLNGETLAGLVNNAGIAVSGPVMELAADEFRRQMEVNFIGPIIAPGAVKTPILDKAQDISIYRNSPYFPAVEKIRAFTQHLSKIGLPERIAEAIVHALTAPNPKVRYQITPDPMRHLMMSWLPKRTVDKIIARRLGLTPQP
jgi:NAD(P)-dependent dehydrogenase (short-subunit alcohol dehydrogenase family)